MPMILLPGSPPITPPETVTSPDGWLTAVVDAQHAGVVLGIDYTEGTPLADVEDVRKVLLVRQDPGATGHVPVRSGDTAWALEGIGAAYDHEAPLGVAVAYTATPQYADGSWGPDSSLAVLLPAPTAPADVWIKSLDEPGLSARVTVLSWPTLAWASRIDAVAVEGSRFPAASQDVYAAATSDIALFAEGSAIDTLEVLLSTPGVRLIQTRPGYHRADMYVLLGDVKQEMHSTPGQSRTYTASATQVARPPTAGQALRLPGWSWDEAAAQHATWNAFAASYSTWASASVAGAV